MIAAAVRGLTVRQFPADQLDNWRESCERLAGNFMQHPAWIVHAWTRFHSHSPGIVESAFLGFTAADDENLVGCSAWFKQIRYGVQWWRLVGSGRVCSDYASIPCEPGLEYQAAVALADWFDSQPRKLLDLPTAIEVEGHRAECPQWQTFFEELDRRGWSSDSIDIEGAWRLDLPPDWRTYEASLHKSERRRARRLSKLLQNGAFSTKIYRTATEMEANWSHFIRLHQDRRQSIGQAGCFADARFEEFLRFAALELAGKNLAWLLIVESEGRPIAALLAFDWGGVSHLYQSGFDVRHKSLKPGHVAIVAMTTELIRRGQHQFDFLRGDEPYKKDWLANRTSLKRTILLPPGFSGRSLSAGLKLRRSIRNWRSRKP